jgi:hypothetical protein
MAILIGLLSICGAIVAHMIASELYHHHAPRLAVAILNRAVWFLPAEEQSRYLEEWTAHLHQQDGAFAKLLHAVQCWLAGRSLSRVLAARPTAETAVTVTVSVATVQFLENVLPRFQESTDHSALIEVVKEELANGSLPAPDPKELHRVADALLRASGRLVAKREK